MSQSQKHNQSRGRMLAFLLLLALFTVTGIPHGQDAFAGGTGGNDTLGGSPAIDTTEVVTAEKESTSKEEMSFGDWLLMMASMLL